MMYTIKFHMRNGETVLVDNAPEPFSQQALTATWIVLDNHKGAKILVSTADVSFVECKQE
jgi:hypothetical protein